MSQLRWLVLSLLLISGLPEPSSGQARALLVFGQGGRMFPLLNLSEAGDDLSSGRAWGGGIGLQLGATTALRASVNISNTRHQGPSLELDATEITRYYYGLDLMFGAPSNLGLAPYVFFGAGRIRVKPGDPHRVTFKKLAGRFGTGLNYVPDNSFFVLFVEACGWLYEFELYGFSELQFNAAALGGIAFAIPF